MNDLVCIYNRKSSITTFLKTNMGVTGSGTNQVYFYDNRFIFASTNDHAVVPTRVNHHFQREPHGRFHGDVGKAADPSMTQLRLRFSFFINMAPHPVLEFLVFRINSFFIAWLRLRLYLWFCSFLHINILIVLVCLKLNRK